MEFNKGNKFRKKVRENRKKVEELIGKEKFTRIYFGNEFCEFLIPSKKDIDVLVEKIKEKNLDFTLVTPVVTDYGLGKIQEVIEYLYELDINNFEVVFNDWGTMQLIKEKYNNLTLIAGRVLDKTPRDPRVKKDDYSYYFTEEGQSYIKKSSISSISYQNILIKNNIMRAELDLLPQGYEMNNCNIDVNVSLYIPYGFVTTGRLCMVRNLGSDNKFCFGEKKCSHNCKKYDQLMVKQIDTYIDLSDKEKVCVLELFRKGNTVFYENRNLNEIDNYNFYHRIVYQPNIPM